MNRTVVCPECGEEFIPGPGKRGRKRDPQTDDIEDQLKIRDYLEVRVQDMGGLPLARFRDRVQGGLRYRGMRVRTRVLDDGTLTVERVRP